MKIIVGSDKASRDVLCRKMFDRGKKAISLNTTSFEKMIIMGSEVLSREVPHAQRSLINYIRSKSGEVDLIALPQNDIAINALLENKFTFYMAFDSYDETVLKMINDHKDQIKPLLIDSGGLLETFDMYDLYETLKGG